MPFGWSRGNFPRKMTAVVLLASGTALATLTVAFLLLDSVRSRYELQSRLSTLADVVGQNSTAALHFSDATAAVEVLEALRAEVPITSVCLYEVSGGLFARYQRDNRRLVRRTSPRLRPPRMTIPALFVRCCAMEKQPAPCICVRTCGSSRKGAADCCSWLPAC